MDSAVLLNSGGVDSLATAIIMSKRFKLYSLNILMGQTNSRVQADASKLIADEYCENHHTMNIFGDSSSDEYSVYRLFTDRKQFAYIPSIVHLLGATYAISNKCSTLTSGMKVDLATKEWRASFENLCHCHSMWKDYHPMFIFPLYNKDQNYVSSVIRENTDLASKTHSCLLESKCGVCDRCLRRKQIGIDK